MIDKNLLGQKIKELRSESNYTKFYFKGGKK